MAPGPGPNNKKGASVNVDYSIHIQEIKPWPPSQSLKSLRSAFIQWENGERKSGSTNTVIPLVGSLAGEGKIEFNESFRLRTSLVREMSAKGRDAETFQKNCLEFNLYEPRRDKAQLIATAVIDLSDYGVVKNATCTSAVMNCKRSFSNAAQPVLYLIIQPFDKGRVSTSLRDNMSKETSLNKNGGGSVSTLMNEEYAEEAELASLTDDDGSSHSSLTVSSSTFESNGGLPPQNQEKGPAKLNSHVTVEKEHSSPYRNLNGSSCHSSSVDLSSETGSPARDHASTLNSPNPSAILNVSTTIISSQTKSQDVNTRRKSYDYGHSSVDATSSADEPQMVEKQVTVNTGNANMNGEKNGKTWKLGKNSLDGAEENCYMEDTYGSEGHENVKEKEDLEDEKYHASSNQVSLESDGGAFGTKDAILKDDKSKQVKSVRSSPDPCRSNGLITGNQHTEAREVGALRDAQNISGFLRTNERKDARSSILDGKIRHLEHRIMLLEGELREAAAIEAALYSVVAEHGSSMSKIHAPARRLSRMYLHACKESYQPRKASVARNAASGLVLVAKACGNDVPRLTFWLSNSVVLRAIICQATGDLMLPISTGLPIERNGGGREKNKTSSSLKWNGSPNCKKNDMDSSFGNWEDPRAFISALERIEAWIFTRIIESIWWQTLTPHMQSAATKAIDGCLNLSRKKEYKRKSSLGDQDQENLSSELWKKAFKDACERICPVRAGGHECGCLPVLARLIMEQCVARLDVAMFNAILRESADDIPTDPVSDPISDPKVLPIAVGKASFGAGAQLKTAIGNWSRWLTDLFGLDDGDECEDEIEYAYSDERHDPSFKSFHLLNALSDLMMLPKDMLLSSSIRKEVCPAFGPSLIKRVLDKFVPDEFCPDPVPDAVLEALESEDPFEAGEDAIINFPCNAAPPVYSPPSADSLADIICGETGRHALLRRSGSSLIRKAYTSDDELDELNSPLASVLMGSSQSSSVAAKPSWRSKDNGSQNSIRYSLLREVWMNSE